MKSKMKFFNFFRNRKEEEDEVDEAWVDFFTGSF